MQLYRPPAIISLVLMSLSLGCGEEASSNTPFSKASDFGTFLGDRSHHQSGWVSETQGPREAASVVSPHGPVRVFLNETLVASQKAENGDLNGAPHTEGSMAVKELYDGESVVGYAIYYKSTSGSAPESFVYYCEGPAGRCLQDEPETSRESPIYGAGHDVHCHYCHGGLVFTAAP